ncbi:MAG TPA: hypothetical protein DCX14_03095 [Flavobacteriales bacterium]|nr:hypothetical protein [Betaproteobacteria bacterium]HAW19144.1 hypothetical protein [Flavobacteriales bacterium]
MRQYLLTISSLLFGFNSFGQSLVINEVLADNSTTILDEDSEYHDWIEIYNTSGTAVSLGNIWLSDDEQNIQKWSFPNIHIEPFGYMTVFASSKDRTEGELHANFKIEEEGEALFLSNENGTIIDQILTEEVAKNRSFGRLPDGGNWFALEQTSWASSNDINDAILCSHPPGFYQANISIDLFSVMEDDLYYTLDGSIPTESSMPYKASIVLTNPDEKENIISEIPTVPEQNRYNYPDWHAPEEKIDKANVLRFRSFRNGLPVSAIKTRTFFIDHQIDSKYTLPIVSLVTDPDHLFGEEHGIYVPGLLFDAEDADWTTNYLQKGEEWEREIHFEYFDLDGTIEVAQDAGVRIHGSKSRAAPQKSLRLYARSDYGKRGFNYPFLPQKPHETFKRLLLYSPMCDLGESMLKDVIAGDIVSGLDFESQSSREAVVFINGEYWGIHIIRERVDKYFISANGGVDSDSIDFFSAQTWTDPIEGTNIEYFELLDFIEANNLSNGENYNHVKAIININNYLEYVISEMFLANYDWPGNNQKLWKPAESNVPFRWIFFDLSYAFNGSDFNMFEHCTEDESTTWPNFAGSTLLFRKLLENAEFRQDFEDKFTHLLKTQFDKISILQKANSKKQIFDPEIPRHIQRWGFPSSYSNWLESVDEDIFRFLEERPCFIQDQLIDFLALESIAFNCEGTFDEREISLGPNPNSGVFSVFNNSSAHLKGSLTLSRITGEPIYHDPHFEVFPTLSKLYDIRNLESKIYILNIQGTDFAKTIKLIVINE